MSGIPGISWTKHESKASTVQEFDTTEKKPRAKFDELTPAGVSLATFVLGSVSGISSIFLYKRFGRRVRNSEWVTPKLLTKKRWLKGVVTRLVRRFVS
jgi:hypothetical protein